MTRVGNFVWTRWLSVPYAWRRRIVIGAIVWVVFRVLAWQWGFGTLVVGLLGAVAVTYVIAELGVRRLIPTSFWFYKQFTGQLIGVVFALLFPIVSEAWYRAIRGMTADELILAAATTAVFAYLWWLTRAAVFAPAEELQRTRDARRKRKQ